jgi:steroid delta-isomerase-like uncharacterized protein
MSEQENIKVVQASYDAWNAHDLETYSQVRTEDFLSEQPGAPAPLNRAQSRLFAQAYLAAFPDAHIEVTLLIAHGNYVVAHTTATGTHTGPLSTPTGRSISATGKPVVMKASETHELQGDKIVRSWSFADLATLLGQLGVLPPV